MNTSPKIVVFKTREIIYTLLLLFLAVLLVLCLVLMFTKKDKTQTPQGMSTEGGTTEGSTAESTAQDSTLQSNTSQSSTSQSSTSQSSTSQSSATEQTTAEETAGESKETGTQTQPLSTANGYTPGVYTTPITLGDSTVDVEVTVDSDHINSIRLVNLSEVTAAAYPLVSPSLDHIASQILEKQKLDGITCPQENRYTSQLLLSAVSEALAAAAIQE